MGVMPTPPLGSPSTTNCIVGCQKNGFGPPPVVSRDDFVSVWLVTAIAEPSSVCARPKGSPGIVALRVLNCEFGSLPVACWESHRLSVRTPHCNENGGNELVSEFG